MNIIKDKIYEFMRHKLEAPLTVSVDPTHKGILPEYRSDGEFYQATLAGKY